MNANLKKFLAIIVIVCAVAASGCSFRSESRQQLLTISNQVARALASCDFDELETYIDKESDVNSLAQWEEWNARLTFVPGRFYEDSNSVNAVKMIADAITYELYPDTVKISDNSGSIKCVFTIPDYQQAVQRDDVVLLDDFRSALFKKVPVEYEVTLNFRQKDGNWFITECSDIMNVIYDFTNYEYSYIIPLKDLVIGSQWIEIPYMGYYEEMQFIGYGIQFVEGTDYSGIYCVIRYNGREIKREYDSNYSTVDAFEDGVPTENWGYDTYLATGDYEFTFYDPDGNELVSESITVYSY